MKKIVITEFMDESAVAALRSTFNVVYDPKLVDDTNRLMAIVANADGIIVRNRTQVRGDLLAACAQTTVIGRLGVGLDNIDVAACEARGMEVIPATGANALSVAFTCPAIKLPVAHGLGLCFQMGVKFQGPALG